MKTLASLLALLIFSFAYAATGSINLVGTWTSGCIQSNVNGHSGNVIETYSFAADNHYSFERAYYRDGACTDSLSQSDSENGTITIGRGNTNQGFNPSGTVEVQYSNEISTDKGLAWVSADGSKLRVARGMGSVQNTMLGFFQYSKTL
jgi:hypothetical protein